MDFNYTIREFDDVNKIVRVDFEDGNWAELRLANPLPKNIADLEEIIKQFTAPVEAVQAWTNPDADLSYIAGFIGEPRTCARKSLRTNQQNVDIPEESMAEMAAAEQAMFESHVVDVLKKVGVLPQ